MPLQRFGVLAHPKRPQTVPVAEHIAETLRARGVDVWQFSHWTDADIQPHLDGTDMVIAIGGDGAMLRAGRATACDAARAREHGIPVLGVNMGQLGFLTEIAPDEWENTLDPLLNGSYWVEQRMLLRVQALRNEQTLFSGDALNDVVISRGSAMRMIRLETHIDGGWTTTYNADALIIASATGSTAYALASGGPILPPELRNLLIVPVAPHLSLDRPIVLPEGANVDVIVPEGDGDVLVAADGEGLGELEPGDRARVQASDRVACFVRLREKTYFYRSLLDRLEPRA